MESIVVRRGRVHPIVFMQTTPLIQESEGVARLSYISLNLTIAKVISDSQVLLERFNRVIVSQYVYHIIFASVPTIICYQIILIVPLSTVSALWLPVILHGLLFG